MKAVKLSAKCDMKILEQAKIEFQQRIGHLHGGIWTNEQIRISTLAQQRYTQILQDYYKIKANLVKVW